MNHDEVVAIVWCWQFLLLAGVCFSWFLTHQALKGRYPEYAELERSKQVYIVKNLVKSVLLGCMTPLAMFVITRVAFYGIFDSILFQVFGCIYASSDIVGLVALNRHLPRSTLLHHLCVVGFVAKSITMDYADPANEPFRQVGMLGAFSAITFPVNAHLAMRSLLDRRKEYLLRRTGLMVYLPAVGVSLAWQIFNTTLAADVATVIYVLALALIFYDDAVLLSFLARDENRPALLFFAALVIPCAYNWMAGRTNEAAIEMVTMLLGIANLSFQHWSLEVGAFSSAVIASSYGLAMDRPWSLILMKAYLILTTVAYQILIQGHKVFGHHHMDAKDPHIFFSGTVFAAAMLRLWKP